MSVILKNLSMDRKLLLEQEFTILEEQVQFVSLFLDRNIILSKLSLLQTIKSVKVWSSLQLKLQKNLLSKLKQRLLYQRSQFKHVHNTMLSYKFQNSGLTISQLQFFHSKLMMQVDQLRIKKLNLQVLLRKKRKAKRKEQL